MPIIAGTYYHSINHTNIFTKEFKEDYKKAENIYKNMSKTDKDAIETIAFKAGRKKALKYSGTESAQKTAGKSAAVATHSIGGLLVVPALAGFIGDSKGYKLGKLTAIQSFQQKQYEY